MNKFAFIILAMAATPAMASELYLDAGLGAFSTEGDTLSQVKFARVGVQGEILQALVQRFNVGGWLDQRGAGYTDSAFAGYQLGFDVRNDALEMAIFSGPTYISSSDVALGGNFQFNETIYVGIHDPKSDDSIGMAYNHFSSAGLEMPNLGKDFVCLEIKFPL
jgi:hypothetical protein